MSEKFEPRGNYLFKTRKPPITKEDLEEIEQDQDLTIMDTVGRWVYIKPNESSQVSLSDLQTRYPKWVVMPETIRQLENPKPIPLSPDQNLP